jgi:D-alanyl-D-alanine carboxypeptidase/D-alanyl-D-alanine-endopeptidase (penicillin-binding protein 4)
MFHPALLRAVLPGLLLLPVPLRAQSPALPPARSRDATQLAAAIERGLADLLARVPNATRVGFAVADAATGTMLFGQGADQPLTPASVQKLFVTAAALERFGAGFRFETRVFLVGDELWVLGAGDPGLGDERLAQRHGHDQLQVFEDWAAALRARGVTALARIVLDDSVFDREWRHPDWPANQADRWYQAPVGGLNVNDNCLDVTAVVRDGKVLLHSLPPLPATLVKNSAVARAGKRQSLTVGRPAASDAFEVKGVATRGGILDPVAARDPTLFFAYALKEALARQGIDVQGDVVRRTFTPTELSLATPLASHITPLADVLWRCNTFSQNLFAEAIYKALSAYEPDGRRGATPGSWAASNALLRLTLSRLSPSIVPHEIRDGSGLSHSNRATAAQLTQLLVRMRAHPLGGIFVESLARPGETGSMERRFNDAVLRNRIRAKTGTLANVHALAGYVTRADGRELAFALLVNGPGGADLPLRVAKLLVTAD